MRYAEFRERIASGDLLAWSHRTGWFSSWYDFKVNLIRLFTRSEYTHVGLAWVCGGRVWVVEAVTPLVRVVPLSAFAPFYHLPMGLPWSPAIEEFALSFVGNEGYRYSQSEGIAALFGRSDASNALLECAEYVKLVAEFTGVALAGNATPTDVVLAAQGRGGSMTYIERG